jgi:DNA-3-methyladenine glycosylase I
MIGGNAMSKEWTLQETQKRLSPVVNQVPNNGALQILPVHRCGWSDGNELYNTYHDAEWGVSVHDDKRLFEFLILEGAQAGLSWITVLKKREAYRAAFDGFDPKNVATYSGEKIEELLQNQGIIRNRLKIKSAVQNANAFLAIQKEYGSFDQYIWSYVDGKPIVGHWRALGEVPVTSDLSDKISKELKKQGFNFVGSTIIYSFLQATGIVMDHITSCFRYDQLKSVE